MSGRLSQHDRFVRGHREVLTDKAAVRRSSFISFTTNIPAVSVAGGGYAGSPILGAEVIEQRG